MKMKYAAALIFILLSPRSEAQFTRHIIYLKDKATTSHSFTNPSSYLSERAISRRARYQVAIDSTDLPIPAAYISQLQALPGITILNQSRWLNAVCVRAEDDAALSTALSLPFVATAVSAAARQALYDPFSVSLTNTTVTSSAQRNQSIQDNNLEYGDSPGKEIQLHNGQFLHNLGLQGQGMQVALLDAGYFRYKTLRAFDSVNTNGQVISTWDFVSGNSEVNEDHSHGMQCFSIIAANIPGEFVGKAPQASFHLFRTEDAATEYLIEEFNWACGAERADSTGADIISSSLGYGYGYSSGLPDLSYSDLDGKTTIAARAATMAARKGLLVFNAAGNAGEQPWKMILTPADADSVMAVGAVNSSGSVGAFSSYGPSADGRIKPDVASVGVSATIQLANNNIGQSNGTSLACPNMAGLATCLWQAFPEFNNMRIAQALKASGHIYQNPDNRTGYGIPDMKKAFAALVAAYSTASVSLTPCEATITWASKDAGSMRYEIERRAGTSGAYIKVGDMPAKPGAVLQRNEYVFKDALAGIASGNISYRIRQVIDTTTTGFAAVYTDTLLAPLTGNCLYPGNNRALLAPNPVTGAATLAIHTDEEVASLVILAYSLDGKEVFSMKTSKPAGLAAIPVHFSNLAAGKYILKAYANGRELESIAFLKL